jgi:hypothetical protein
MLGKSLDFGLGLWRLHIMAIQVERMWEFMAKGLDFGLGLWRLHTIPSKRLQFLYFIGYFSAHFFALSIEFGHSIPWPLDLDSHSVKQPLGSKTPLTYGPKAGPKLGILVSQTKYLS